MMNHPPKMYLYSFHLGSRRTQSDPEAAKTSSDQIWDYLSSKVYDWSHQFVDPPHANTDAILPELSENAISPEDQSNSQIPEELPLKTDIFVEEKNAPLESDQLKPKTPEIPDVNLGDLNLAEENQISAKAFLESEAFRSKVLSENFEGIETLRPFQSEAMTEIISHRKSLFVQNYTSSGKSLIFQLNALLNPGLTIVITPFVAITLGNLSNII